MQVNNHEGRKFGHLTALSHLSKPSRWICRCDCGNIVIVRATNLQTGNTKSCGCARMECHTLHGCCGMPEYKIWEGVINRCHCVTSTAWKNYGARGIKVCDRWRSSFVHFLADMGPRPSGKHSIERVDNDGDYEPQNCRWATIADQARNKRRTIWISYQGQEMCLRDWSLKLGIGEKALRSRLRRPGWTVERAFAGPFGGR